MSAPCFEDKPRLDESAMAMRAAAEVKEGMVANLGFGIPMLISSFVDPDAEVLLHSENGVIGFGSVIEDPARADRYCINGGGQPVERRPGMSFMSHEESFTLIRGGWVDVTFLGALQVAANGDLANWKVPGKISGALGGGQDLAFCAKSVVCITTHQTKDGTPKIVNRLSLDITAPRCVKRLITDIAVIDVTPTGLALLEVLPGWSPEEVQRVTEPTLEISADVLEMAL
ncbi:MAG: CoA-transferase [Acidimicrobiales bacterium]